MVAFIEEHRAEHGVEPICAVLPIAPATYYEHRAWKRDPNRRCRRAKRDDQLSFEIERVWKANSSVYGAEKATAAPRGGRRGALHGGAADALPGPARCGSWSSVQGHDGRRRVDGTSTGSCPAGLPGEPPQPASHSVLDGLMHEGIAPLLPFSAANPFRGLTPYSVLAGGLVLMAGFGAAAFVWHVRRLQPAESRGPVRREGR
jgi:hypothetical protein